MVEDLIKPILEKLDKVEDQLEKEKGIVKREELQIEYINLIKELENVLDSEEKRISNSSFFYGLKFSFKAKKLRQTIAESYKKYGY